MGKGELCRFSEIKLYSNKHYDFERVQLIERVVLFLFHASFLSAASGNFYLSSDII